jgi:hypothetical protein
VNDSAPTPRRVRYGRILAVVTALTTVAGTVTVTAAAHADSGRRICEYSFKASPMNSSPNNPRHPTDPPNSNTKLRVSIGMNYKKDGPCPSINRDKLAATGYVDVDQVNPAASPNKWSCEDWGDTHQMYLGWVGGDPCYKMWDDTMYAFMWQDPTTSNAPTPWYQELGHYWDYQ